MGSASAAHGRRWCRRWSRMARRCGSAVIDAGSLRLVIASAAKQSRVFPLRDSGLLRCARNDGARCGIARLQRTIQFADTPSRPRGMFRPSFASSLYPRSQEGAGKAGCQLAPAVRCAKSTRRKNRTAAYRCSQSLGLPCAMVGRLMPCSPGSRIPSGLPRPHGIHRPCAG